MIFFIKILKEFSDSFHLNVCLIICLYLSATQLNASQLGGHGIWKLERKKKDIKVNKKFILDSFIVWFTWDGAKKGGRLEYVCQRLTLSKTFCYRRLIHHSICKWRSFSNAVYKRTLVWHCFHALLSNRKMEGKKIE